jgi:uncharacterized protein
MSEGKSQAGNVPSGAGGDPSMEDILASIRRILSEEDLPAGTPPAPPIATGLVAEAPRQPEVPVPDVLVLDESMLVDDTLPVVARSPVPPAPPIIVPPVVVPEFIVPEFIVPAAVMPEPEEPEPEEPEPEPVMPEPVMPEPVMLEPVMLERVPGPIMAREEHPMPKPPPIETAFELAAPEMVKMEPPIPSGAFPPLTPDEMEPEDAMFAVKPPVVPAAAAMLDTSPVFMPVPGGASSPLVRHPAPVMATDPAFDAAPRQPAETGTEPFVLVDTSPQSESSPMSSSNGLASPETANAAAGSVNNLVRALTSDRGTQVHSGGPTIADIVREEIRPLLKEWLDSNLPPLVERLVRIEIERVISRAAA